MAGGSAEEMDNIQGVMIKGMGDGRAFCAGGDVRAAVIAARGGDVGALTLPRPPRRLCSVASGLNGTKP